MRHELKAQQRSTSYITKPTLPRCYGRISINYLSVINQNHGNLTADFLIKKLKKESTRIPKINWQTAWIAGQCECLKKDLFNAVSDWLRDCLESYRTIAERSKMNNIIHDKFPHLFEYCFTRLEDVVTCLVRGVASQYKQAGTPNQPLVQSFTGVLYPTRPDPTQTSLTFSLLLTERLQHWKKDKITIFLYPPASPCAVSWLAMCLYQSLK